MKKTLAKFMAGAMLVTSLPAMAMPTFNVEAATTVAANGADGQTVSAVKFVGTYAQNTFIYKAYDENAEGHSTVKSTDGAPGAGSILKFNAYYGMSSPSTNVWDTKIQYQYVDDKTDADHEKHDLFNADTKKDGTKVANKTLRNGSGTKISEVKDYVDSTGTVSKITTDANGNIQVTFDAGKLNTYKQNLQKGTTANTIKFYPFHVVSTDKETAVAAFEIQVGETLNTNKSTKISHVSTPDQSIQDAEVEITRAGNAILTKISDTDKKVNMKDKDIEVTVIEVGGIEYPVWKFDDQVMKKSTMKTITAKNVKHLGAGCLRNCKKLRKVRMGGAKMRKIHSNAFYDCGKLKNIKIKCHNLKAVGKNAFNKLKKKCTIAIKANQNKYKAVVKMIKRSGVGTVKFKRV